MLHAWFSHKQVQVAKEYYTYQRSNGENITVSQVGAKIEFPPLFDDTVYLGEVEKFIKQHKNPFW